MVRHFHGLSGPGRPRNAGSQHRISGRPLGSAPAPSASSPMARTGPRERAVATRQSAATWKPIAPQTLLLAAVGAAAKRRVAAIVVLVAALGAKHVLAAAGNALAAGAGAGALVVAGAAGRRGRGFLSRSRGAARSERGNNQGESGKQALLHQEPPENAQTGRGYIAGLGGADQLGRPRLLGRSGRPKSSPPCRLSRTCTVSAAVLSTSGQKSRHSKEVNSGAAVIGRRSAQDSA